MTMAELQDSFNKQRDSWNKSLQDKSPREIIEWALKTFSPSLQSNDNLLVQTTAFGATGMVIRDMIHDIQTASADGSNEKAVVPLVFIDTLYRK